jgi:uncharacterized protein (TIGR02453 family)
MKNTLNFLEKIKENNNREWFLNHKADYEAVVKENKAFFNQVFTEFQKYDSLKDIHQFRIYNDVRFSKDKSPYKSYLGLSISRTKPALRGGYYIHLEPNKSFVGGGFWAPNSNDLYRIRKEFEAGTAEIEAVVSSPTFKHFFGELKGEEAVKTAPKGFDKNHPAIGLIKKRQFIVKRTFSNDDVLSGHFQAEIIATFKAMRPFFDYMSEVLTSDLNGNSLL